MKKLDRLNRIAILFPLVYQIRSRGKRGEKRYIYKNLLFTPFSFGKGLDNLDKKLYYE